MTTPLLGAGLLLVALLSTGCGQFQSVADGRDACGLNQPYQVENPVEGGTASVKGTKASPSKNPRGWPSLADTSSA
jgi:hypothetical protein